MTEPTLSLDGKWLWNGTEWIPAPPTAAPAVVSEAQPIIQQVAQNQEISVQELTQAAQNYDLNHDQSLSQYEIELAASAIKSPPLSPYSPAGNKLQTNNRNKIIGAVSMTSILLFSITFWLLSPNLSPLDSIHDEDGDGIPDGDDRFIFNPTQTTDSDMDGYGDNQDMNATQIDNFTLNPTQWADLDGDGYGDNQDPNATQVDNFTMNPTQWADLDGDGYGDNQSEEATQVDNFITNPTQWADSDGDGYGDNQSDEATQVDDFPLNPTQWRDTDGDGHGDNQSDGATQVDNFTTNPSQWADSDGDGYGDNQSDDATQVDDFPLNPTQWQDTDGDGYGDNQDNDATQVDAFPTNPSQWIDSDNDGYGDNQASGASQVDAFPNDPNEWRDDDNDGFGNNADDCVAVFGTSIIDVIGCVDLDGDGYSNNGDAFPLDSSEWFDDDGDGIGNNADILDDGDAYISFDVVSLQADTLQDYDIFGNAPDMFMTVWHDANCNGVSEEDETDYFTDYKLDSYSVTLSDGLSIGFNVPDEQGELCFAIFIYDSDDSEDDILDYSNGEYVALYFVKNLDDGFDTTLSYNNNDSGEYKTVDMIINIYVW